MKLCISSLLSFSFLFSIIHALDNAIEELHLDVLDKEHMVVDLKVRMYSNSLIDDYILFPRTVGKLLHHIPIRGFSLNFVQGSWKWNNSAYPYTPMPQGSTLTASLSKTYANKAWRHLTSSLGGMVCAALLHMDKRAGNDLLDPTEYPLPYVDLPQDWTSPDSPTVPIPSTPFPAHLHDSVATWSLPLGSEDNNLITRVATLPFEPLCTENLSSLLRITPCQGSSGLASLINSLSFGSAPFKHLSLSASSHPGDGSLRMTVHVRMAVRMISSFENLNSLPNLGQQLFDLMNEKSLTDDFSYSRNQKRANRAEGSDFRECPLIDHSYLSISQSLLGNMKDLESSPLKDQTNDGIFSLSPFHFENSKKSMPSLKTFSVASPLSKQSSPLSFALNLLPSTSFLPLLSIQRDLLSHPDLPGDKRRSSYRLHLQVSPTSSPLPPGANPPLVKVRCIEHLPLFITPLLSTLKVIPSYSFPLPSLPLLTPRRLHSVLSLSDVTNIIDLQVRGPASLTVGNGFYLSFSFEVPEGGSLTLLLDVEKSFMPSTLFAAAADRGVHSGETFCSVTKIDEFDSKKGAFDTKYNSMNSENVISSSSSTTMLPLPDFAMVFNAVALGLLGITLHFSGIFKILGGNTTKTEFEDDGTLLGLPFQPALEKAMKLVAMDLAISTVRSKILLGKEVLIGEERRGISSE